MSDAAALVRMANQIAANLAHHPQDTVVAELAAHLRTSWAPEMRAELVACVDAVDSLNCTFGVTLDHTGARVTGPASNGGGRPPRS